MVFLLLLFSCIIQVLSLQKPLDHVPVAAKFSRSQKSTTCRCDDNGDACCTMTASCQNLVKRVTNEVAQDFELDVSFYKKYVEALGGIAVVSSDATSDEAIIQMAKVINHMLQNREDIARLIADLGIQFTVMAAYPTEVTTDVPEHSNMDSSYWDERARGLGSTCGSKVTSGSEENALCYSDDRYSNSCIGLHEFAHTVHERGMMSLYPVTFNRIRELFKTRSAHLYDNTYANTNENEFFAELSQSYFDCQRQDGNRPSTRQELLELHPEMYAVLRDFYGDITVDPCPAGEVWGTDSINVNCDDFWAGNAPRDYTHFPLPPTPECPCIQHFQDTPLCSPQSCTIIEESHIAIDERIQSCTADVLTTSAAATPDPALTTRAPDCEDNHSNCESWAAGGECERNPGYMLSNCKKSCGECDIATWPPTKAPVAVTPHPCGCVDDNFNCPGWAASGECQNNPNYMLHYCKISCNTCPSCDNDCEGYWSECTSECETAEERVWTETSAQLGEGKACPLASDCQPGEGQCADSKTCTRAEWCQDSHQEFCQGWADGGECDVNPGYMHECCKNECGLCSTSKVTTPSPTTTTTKEPTPSPTPHPTTSPPTFHPTTSPTDAKPDCSNNYSDNQCNAWKPYCPGGTRSGFESWMESNCCKACSTVETCPRAGWCDDAHQAFCQGWADSGECDINPGYMHECCRYECGLCVEKVEQAVGDDAEVACTLPDPDEVDGYQYFYPNMLGGCTSKNCDNPIILGPFSCTSSSTFFGTGLAQMNGCTADNPQVTFSGCEQVLMWNILASPSASVIHGLAILGLFSTLAFFAQRIFRKGKYEAISEV